MREHEKTGEQGAVRRPTRPVSRFAPPGAWAIHWVQRAPGIMASESRDNTEGWWGSQLVPTVSQGTVMSVQWLHRCSGTDS